MLLLSLLAVLAGSECFTHIARFSENKLDLLRPFLPFEHGTPPHDTLGDIFDKKADYVLALRGNRGNLSEDVEVFANEQKTRAFADTAITARQTLDGDHGRIETRKYTVVHEVGWLRARHEWPGLKGVVMVESQRETSQKVERVTRYFITSTTLEARILSR